MFSPSSFCSLLLHGSVQALSGTLTAVGTSALAAAGNRLLPRLLSASISGISTTSSSSSSRTTDSSKHTTTQQLWSSDSSNGQAFRAQHSMVQEEEGLAEYIHEDPRLAKIEAVKKKVRCSDVLTFVSMEQQAAHCSAMAVHEADVSTTALGMEFVPTNELKVEAGLCCKHIPSANEECPPSECPFSTAHNRGSIGVQDQGSRGFQDHRLCYGDMCQE